MKNRPPVAALSGLARIFSTLRNGSDLRSRKSRQQRDLSSAAVEELECRTLLAAVNWDTDITRSDDISFKTNSSEPFSADSGCDG